MWFVMMHKKPGIRNLGPGDLFYPFVKAFTDLLITLRQR